MSKQNTYTIYFKGETRQGFEPETVKERIASLFNVQADEVAHLFDGKKIFKRSGLNKFTAEQYKHKLIGLGAQCYLEQETELPIKTVRNNNKNHKASDENHSAEFDPHKLERILCPKCQSTNINAVQCLDCGVYFEKLRKKISTQDELLPESKKEDNSNYLTYMQKAIRIIKYVIIYLLAVFTVDNYLLDNQESLRYVVDPGIDISILPYLIGHIGLVWGCYYLALAKGRSGLWGGLGLASLPGLGVLLLLPNEHATKSDVKSKAFAIVMILLSVYWVIDYFNKSAALSKFIEEGVVLREQRFEYPENTFDTQTELYESEIDELKEYLNQGFALLSEYNYRPREASAISDFMFSETMRLFIWINYQQYLQYRNGETGAEFLQKKNVSRVQVDMFKFIKNGVETVDVFALSQSFEEWFFGTNYEGEYAFLHTFYNELFEYKSNLFRINAFGEKKVNPPNFSFENIDAPRFSTADVMTRGDIMLIDLSAHNVAGVNETLAIAYYYRPYKRYNINKKKQVDNYFLVQVQISPDFPSKYLSGDFSVFNLADILPQMHIQ